MSFIKDLDAPVFIAGHRGLVGSAISRRLGALGFKNLITRTRQELDLTEQAAVRAFFRQVKPRYVFLAAAKVGGIKANNDFKAQFLYENLAIQNNVIQSALDSGTEKLLFLGSSCIYPKHAPQPMKEEHLLTGSLEPTNEAYALAKIAGLKLCQYLNEQQGKRFISAMPTNLYGPGDNFHPEHSHVIPGMMLKFHRAKEAGAPFLELWGTGSPRREFLHSDDLAEALLHLMDCYEDAQTINVGCGEDLSIRELAQLMAEVVGYTGELRFNPAYPDGTPRKLLDVSRMGALGWRPRIALRAGLAEMYRWARENSAFSH